jgi:sigma-B regulation protein RsbU (phosphoserine phosphatase)
LLIDDFEGEGETMNSVSIPSTSGKGVDVLVVEDSRIQAKILERRLITAGHTVRVAEHGVRGLEMVRERIPAIIVSDIEMPEMNGYELCKALKQEEQYKDIPIILLSTLSDPLDIIKGLDSGADNYVTKPYDPEYLLARMSSLLETPLEQANASADLEVTIVGQKFRVKAGRQQVLNLLVSTFENAVSKNQELIIVNQDLSLAKDQLEHSNRELNDLNQKIASVNSRMVRDLEAAAKVQQSLLPSSKVEFPRCDIAWRYAPCQELAGDFLNVIQFDDEHVGMYVVDVSGHGVPSSLLAVTVGRFLSAQVSDSSILVQKALDGSMVVNSPALVGAHLNRLFPMDENTGLYFTIVYGVLHTPTGLFKFITGGHPALVHVSNEGEAKYVEADGFPIGWVEDAEFMECQIQLQPGERIVMYSDGVNEAMNDQVEQLGNERLSDMVHQGRSHPIEESVQMLMSMVEKWCDPKGPLDDVSILGIEWKGE